MARYKLSNLLGTAQVVSDLAGAVTIAPQLFEADLCQHTLFDSPCLHSGTIIAVNTMYGLDLTNRRILVDRFDWLLGPRLCRTRKIASMTCIPERSRLR